MQNQGDIPRKENLKRKLDESTQGSATGGGTNTSSDFAEMGFGQDPHADPPIPSSLGSIPSEDANTAKEFTSAPSDNGVAASMEEAEEEVLASPPPPPLIPGSRAQIRNRRHRNPGGGRFVANTLSTIGKIGVGAAMMWYGLSEMNL